MSHENYMTKADYEGVLKVLNDKKNGYFLSVRETGEASVKRLGQGCGAKPHSILDKSLKHRSKDGFTSDTDYWNDVLSSLGLRDANVSIATAKELLEGLIPYCVNGKPKGLYLTKLGEKVLSRPLYDLADRIVQPNRAEDAPYAHLNLADDNGHVLGIIRNHIECFFTGDYDLLDLMYFTDGKWQHVSDAGINSDEYETFFNTGQKPTNLPRITGEKDFITFIELISTELLQGAQCRKILGSFPEENANNADELKRISELHFRDYKRIQHGPQGKYLEHMKVHEPAIGAVEGVAGFAWPLLLVHSKLDQTETHTQVVARNIAQGDDQWDDAAEAYRTALKGTGAEIKGLWSNRNEFKDWWEKLRTVKKKAKEPQA